MTAFVHIGVGKTGTSTIQHFLAHHRPALMERGFLYPQAGLVGTGHHGFYDPFTRQVADRVLDELAEEVGRTQPPRVIVSSEYLSYATPALVHGLRRVLEGDVKVLFYVRPQFEFISSTFLQAVKMGSDYRGSLDDYLRYHQNSCDYMNLVAPWSEVFGSDSIVSHVYHPSIVTSDVTRHFLTVVGIEGMDPPVEHLNPSLLPEFFDVVRVLDEGGIDPRLREQTVSRLLDASVRLRASSTASLISAETHEFIRERYGESNREFAARYLPESERHLLELS